MIDEEMRDLVDSFDKTINTIVRNLDGRVPAGVLDRVERSRDKLLFALGRFHE